MKREKSWRSLIKNLLHIKPLKKNIIFYNKILLYFPSKQNKYIFKTFQEKFIKYRIFNSRSLTPITYKVKISIGSPPSSHQTKNEKKNWTIPLLYLISINDSQKEEKIVSTKTFFQSHTTHAHGKILKRIIHHKIVLFEKKNLIENPGKSRHFPKEKPLIFSIFR